MIPIFRWLCDYSRLRSKERSNLEHFILRNFSFYKNNIFRHSRRFYFGYQIFSIIQNCLHTNKTKIWENLKKPINMHFSQKRFEKVRKRTTFWDHSIRFFNISKCKIFQLGICMRHFDAIMRSLVKVHKANTNA